MRYSPEHKQASRERILSAARRLFRKHGYDGIGVDGIMRAAGFTRGGFYGHFRSKAELFAEAMGQEHDFVERLRARRGRDRRELAEQALAVARAYLDPANREPVGRGCSLASLAPDTARASKRARNAYGNAVRDLAREFERGLPPPRVRAPEAEPDPRALTAIALCVGGLMLSRAVGQPDLADAISRACSAAVERELSARPKRGS